MLLAQGAQRALVDGAAGAVWAPGGRPRVVFGFTITRGRIVAIDLAADPACVQQLDLTFAKLTSRAESVGAGRLLVARGN
ncbi:MAG: hypothetical protein ACR2JG_00260 [Geodermatophilaceae bacterium]